MKYVKFCLKYYASEWNLFICFAEHHRLWGYHVSHTATKPTWRRCSKCGETKIPLELEDLVFGPWGVIKYYCFENFVCNKCQKLWWAGGAVCKCPQVNLYTSAAVVNSERTAFFMCYTRVWRACVPLTVHATRWAYWPLGLAHMQQGSLAYFGYW